MRHPCGAQRATREGKRQKAKVAEM